jgi:hypothetical protein
VNPALTALLVIALIALLVLRQVLFERNLRRAKQNGTGIFRFSPPVQRVIIVLLIVVVVALGVWRTASLH